ncbi:ribonuclease-like [Pelodiscus sinensis]|uniref:ribonuclease-like n=1 Tax=Pelodiscus sinensis TaxID=13735 RepID=UPI003F6D60D0
MAPGGPRPALLLPLALLAALALPSDSASYQQFLTHHVDFPKTEAPSERLYCARMMELRGLTRRFCRQRNVFLHAPAPQLRALCARGGAHVGRNLYDSPAPLGLTVCRALPGSRPGACRYRAAVGSGRVRVACAQGLPVHLESARLE